MWSPVCSEARIEATAGLQMSQPRPRPYRVTSSVNVRMPAPRAISNSSAREALKCSQIAVDCATPATASSCFSAGTQDPQPVPARVHALSPGTSVAAPELIALSRSPLVTALHEQTCAESGSPASPVPASPLLAPAPSGASSAHGSAGGSDA